MSAARLKKKWLKLTRPDRARRTSFNLAAFWFKEKRRPCARLYSCTLVSQPMCVFKQGALRLSSIRLSRQFMVTLPQVAKSTKVVFSGLLPGLTPQLPRFLSFFFRALVCGLGGLTRLKIRYKGKSFKWHRRLGGLLLRFGHSHLVCLRAGVGIR